MDSTNRTTSKKRTRSKQRGVSPEEDPDFVPARNCKSIYKIPGAQRKRLPDYIDDQNQEDQDEEEVQSLQKQEVGTNTREEDKNEEISEEHTISEDDQEPIEFPDLNNPEAFESRMNEKKRCVKRLRKRIEDFEYEET